MCREATRKATAAALTRARGCRAGRVGGRPLRSSGSSRSHSEGPGQAVLPCVRIPYLLPEQQGCDQDAQRGQEAREAGEQEQLGVLRGGSVPCVWEEGREAEG